MDICTDCGLCCLETEMNLSEKDIERIINNHPERLQREDFSIKSDKGVSQLQNIECQCFFFNKFTKTCKIYDFRPKGCRFYPLIYDIYSKKCVIDKDCPKNYIFYQERKKFQKCCKELQEFVEEELKISLF